MVRNVQISKEVIWKPQPGPQTALISCNVFEVFYGGARGGGKTDGMLGDFAVHANKHGRYAHGVFFRRTYKQLEEVIRRASDIYIPLGAVWLGSQQIWQFPNGASLKMRHLWDGNDAANYQGHSYTWICIEEATNWAEPDAIDKIRATLRSSHSVPVKLRLTGNPGGPGHNWVKQRYITPAPTGYQVITDPESGEERVFIPSRLEDNRALTESDPNYERRLMQSGSPALVKAWRWGVWDIVAGGFFDDLWNPDKHILKSLTIPSTWKFRRSFDWGSSSPSSLGLWAVSDGNITDEGLYFPRGSMIRIGEWYTVEKDMQGYVKPNAGLRLSNKELGAGIVKRSSGRIWSGCVADPSIFTKAGGPSIYDQMREGATDAGGMLIFSKADNNRVAGWQKMRDMLKASLSETPEHPGLWVCENCVSWIRTVPVLQRDDRNPDDVNTLVEDHAADETRYMIMSGGERQRSQEFLV
nr:phage terminase large subunit [bacterium]